MENENVTYEDLLKIIEVQELQIEQCTRDLDFWKDFEFIFNETVDLICVATVDGYFKTINPAFTRLLGYSEQELLTNSFIDYIHPDDIESTYEEIQKLSNGQETVDFIN